MLPIPLDAAPAPSVHPLRLAAITALFVGYAALSHYSASAPDAKGLGAVLSIAPVALIGLFLVWRWTRPLTALLLGASLIAVLYRYWPAVERNFEWSDLIQQVGAYALVAVSFARSLFGGRVPLCTQWADKLHGALTPPEISYMARATVAWTIFYALMALAILILFFAAPLRVWSLFVNFVTFGLIVLMGVVDHAIRHRVLPRRPGGGIRAILQRAILG